MTTAPMSAVIVGAGHRALTYASYAHHRPDRLRIVGVADPNPTRRAIAAAQHNIPPERQFESAEQLTAAPRFADAAINGTMDQQHVPTSLPLLEAGYDLLLEKPIATSEAELMRLVDAQDRHGRKIMICHVLRYAPFYVAIRKRLLSGEIGDILNIQINEHVSYHHMAVGFVRGKWRNKAECGSSMLLAKCCHDLDLLAWMKSGVAPARVSSFGSNTQFHAERAPAGAGTRCLLDCPIEPECLYSAQKHYVDHPQRWNFYVWGAYESAEDPSAAGLTREQMIASLRTDNPYGRCVWKCDNDVVDHQSVMVEFEDGCTATHNMIGGAARARRSIHIVGTTGEIQGELDDQRFVVRRIDPRPGREHSEEIVDTGTPEDASGAFGGHGGGDLRLVDDFVSFILSEQPSISCTSLEDSVRGHLIGYRADQAMQAGQVIEISRA